MPKTETCTYNLSNKETCMNCVKKESSLLNELSFNELAILENDRSVVNYKKGELIYKEGAKPMGLLCLNTGKVKITRQAHNGIAQIVALKKPVDFIDLCSIINNEPYQTSATALDDSSVCIIEKQNFMNIIRQNPDLSFKIMCSFAKELEEANKRFLTMTQKLLRARLTEALSLLYDMYGTLPDGITLNCTVKRAELAAMSNMTTANVIRTLSLLAKEGVLIIDRKKILVKDRNLLKTISELGR